MLRETADLIIYLAGALVRNVRPWRARRRLVHTRPLVLHLISGGAFIFGAMCDLLRHRVQVRAQPFRPFHQGAAVSQRTLEWASGGASAAMTSGLAGWLAGP
jgi:hypothetical protein